MSYVAKSQAQLHVFEEWTTDAGTQNFFHKSVTKTDGSGNVYVAGATVNGSGNYDILVAKYNSGGVQQWIQQYNGYGNYHDFATAVFVDGSGNVYVTGTVTDSLLVQGSDIITMKYNSSGTLQWASRYNGSGSAYDLGADIIVDNGTGDVYITGAEYNSTPNTDAVTIKYNSSGVQQWVTVYNHTTNLNDAGAKIKFGKSGTVAVSGAIQLTATTYAYGTTLYNKSDGTVAAATVLGTGTNNITYFGDMVQDNLKNTYIAGAVYDSVGSSGYNYYLIKLDSTLAVQWERTFDGGSNLEDMANAVKIDAAGYVYITGYTTSSTQGKNITTRKYNSSGAVVWTQTYNDTLNGDDAAMAMTIDANANIYITGYDSTATNKTNYITIKYDSTGAEKWRISYDGTTHLKDKATGICLDELDNVIVTGLSETTPGNYQYITIKYIQNEPFPQYNDYGISTDTIHSPPHVRAQLIVRFNPVYLKMSNIDNRYLHCSKADNFIADTALYAIGQKIFTGSADERHLKMKKVITRKIFPYMASADSISIARNGDRVNVPPFWATLALFFPSGTNEIAVEDSIRRFFPYVYYAHPNFVGEFDSAPNDSLYGSQVSLAPSVTYPNGHINIEEAWEIETGKKFVRVGVFDVGIDTAHPDISVFKRVDIERALSQNALPPNIGRHGTPVAGIIGAKRNNTAGIAGIAGGNGNDSTGVKIYDYDLGNDGPFEGMYIDQVAEAYIVGSAQWYNSFFQFSNDFDAADIAGGHGLNVINSSFGFLVLHDQITDSVEIPEPNTKVPCELCQEAVEFAFRNGAIMVGSRGNQYPASPANYNPTRYKYPSCVKDEFILNTGACGYDGEHKTGGNGIITPSDSYESMYGKGVDVIAPGTIATVYTTKSQTVSPTNVRYQVFSGTSSAAPHVAGVAALILGHVNTPCPSKKNLAPEDVEYIIQKTASDKNTSGYDDLTGWGLLNAGAALKAVEEPKYQIIHVDNTPINTSTVFYDTASLFLHSPYSGGSGAAFANSLPPIPEGVYYVDIYKTTVTVNHSSELSHLSGNSQLLDAWVRNSSSYGCKLHKSDFFIAGWRHDTIDVTSNIAFDSVGFNNTTANLVAYTYYIKTNLDSSLTINQWYPRPSNQLKFAYSIYAYDSLATTVPYYPCDSSVNVNEQKPIVDNFLLNLYPNPSGDNITIEFTLPYNDIVILSIFDLLGREVKNSSSTQLQSGTYKMYVDVSDLSTGTYIVQLRTKNRNVQKKLIVLH